MKKLLPIMAIAILMFTNACKKGDATVAAGGPGAAYAYIGTPVDVTITITGGKAKIVIPEVSMKSTGSGPDVKLSATLQEM